MLALKLLISILYYSLLYVQSYPENWDQFLSLVAVSDENGRKNLLSTSVSIFFGGNGIGLGKYGYGNGIGLRGSTEMNQ